jgi:dGTPase
MGTLCGEFILQESKNLDVGPQDFGSIVAAACLAHDIGNPPFGHSGEDAIQSWFAIHGEPYLQQLSSHEQADLCKFEGNAQGFRLITRLQNAMNQGGFQLTYAVLASFAKYPRSSRMSGADTKKISEKKFGYFVHDASSFESVAKETGLIQKSEGAYARHPLAFLMEAADDICYGIVDLEDGHHLGRISFAQTKELLYPLAFPEGVTPSSSYIMIDDDVGRVEYLRARSIGNLITATVEVFKENYQAIMAGNFEEDLVGNSKFSSHLHEILKLSRAQIYTTPTVLQIEVAGYEILGGLLTRLVPALLSPEGTRSNAHKKIVQIVPKQFTLGKTQYERLLGATDYVSGMTDSFALTLFRRLNGIELPGSAI